MTGQRVQVFRIVASLAINPWTVAEMFGHVSRGACYVPTYPAQVFLLRGVEPTVTHYPIASTIFLMAEVTTILFGFKRGGNTVFFGWATRIREMQCQIVQVDKQLPTPAAAH